MRRFFIVLLCCLLTAVNALAQFASAPAFPGAEGYGRYTTGGRGGTVYHVTTLEDYCDNTDYSSTKTKDSDIVGSLRYAVKKSGARIIVFDVAGTIELKAPLKIQNDDITILGQTAPGDGICLKNYTVSIFANNVIIRYIRCRLGNDGRRYYNSGTALSGSDQIVEDDAMNAYQKTGYEKHNIIIDHCSISWSVDECGSFYGNQDFTLQWCMLTESLRNAGHTKGNHGYCGIWGGERASFHHNMLANHDSRNPRFDHGYVSTLAGPVDYTNNVLYNWCGNSAYGGENLKGSEAKKFNMINNYYKPGNATTKNRTRLLNPTTSCDNCNKTTPNDVVPGLFYISGNYMSGSSTVTNDNTCDAAIDPDSNVPYSTWKSNYSSSVKFKATNLDFASYNTISLHTAETSYNKILQYAGASLSRDAVDTRVCNDAKNGTTSYTTSTGKGTNGATGGFIDMPSDVGGYPTLTGTKATDTDNDGIPDAWEEAHGLNKNSAADALTYTLDKKGYYQNIEVYANNLVEAITKAERAGATETFAEYYPLDGDDPAANLYTVTYNANGHGTCGTANWTQTSEGQNTTLPSVTAASGYTFLGWATSSSATSAQYNAGASYTPSADVTLYAVYQQEQQGGSEGTVEYTLANNGKTAGSANTGTSYTIPGTYIAGEGNTSHTIGLTSDKGVKMRTGNASFSNTSTSLDGKKKFEIDVKSGYTITAITFKAANNYANTSTMTGIYVDGDYSNNLLSSSITFNSEKIVAGGSVSGFTANEKIEFAMETTTVGDVNGTQINFLASITYKTASTPTYTVTYNLNGHGSAIADATGVTALPSPLPTPSASGYTFGGWYTNSSLTAAAVAGAAISANTTLYAKWTSSSSSELLSKTWAQVCDGRMGDSWYGTDEAQSVADIVLAVQKNNGGWMKNDQLHKLTTDEYNTLVAAKGEHSCFDNYATTQEMRFLLKVYNATHVQKYLTAFKSALNLIITAGQGKQGGWGQYWPNSGDGSYQDYITFNDDLMTNIMKMLQNVYEAKGEYAGIVDDATKARCKTAWDAAIQCVLNCQIDDNGTKAIWCAQHDPADFLPAEGRPHEMPSAGPYESSNLLSYLMSIKNPSEDLKTSIRAAVEWMKNHKSFENKAVKDYTNSSGVADRHIVETQGSNLWGRFIQIGGTSGTAIYDKLWNKLKTRGKKRAHHTTGTEYYEYQLLDASYDASKAYKPIYAIYTNDYPELFYRHLYNYDDTPDATDKYGALVATSLKAANRRSYQYLGSWPDAIINTEYPAWEAGLTESDFGGTLTDEEISPATYSSSSGSTWNFSDGFIVTSSSGDYATGNNSTVKFASGRDYTITIPAGYTVKKVSFTGYDNYNTADSYISKFNGTSYNSTQYVFPAKDGTTAIYATHRFDLSSSPVTGSLTFTIAGNQTCLRIHLYCTTGDDDDPAVSDEKTFTFVPNDGTTSNAGGTYTRTSVANPSFSITSSKNISSDSRFKLTENSTYYLNVPSNATVTKVEFTNCSENYYNNPSGSNKTTTFVVASDGATVVTKDANGDVLQYLSEGQLITSTITNHVTGTPISFTASGGQQLAFGSIVVYYTLTDKGSINLLSQTISNGASVNHNGSVIFVFDDDVTLVNNAKIKVNGNDVRTEVSGSSVIGYFWGLTYGSTGNTITLAANSVQDGFGNKYAEPVSITFNVNSKTPVTKKAFDYIVGRDGTTVDAAVTAINNASGTDRYYVFIPDGEYEMAGNQSNKMTWITRANVSLIGQSQNGTILKNTPTSAGISTTSTIEFRGGSNNNYVQDLTLKNQLDYGASGSYGVGVAFYDRGQKNILKNVSLLSNQDTYTSGGSRGYFENCKIAGTVDFICGSGDYYFNGCNLIINDRTTTNVITAPSTLASERWGYVFESCTISAENDAAVTHQGGKYYLGRPWKDAPASTFLNTTLNLLPANAGWTGMENVLAVRFHEYGSKNSSGTALSLSSRSVSACNGATADNPVLTAAQAAEYTMHNVIGGTDGFDPTEYTGQVAVANAHLSGSTLTWDNSVDALCWVVFKDGVYYANPITNSLELTVDGTYTVRAANSMGGLGEASAGVQYVDISAGGAVLVHTASTTCGTDNTQVTYSYDAETEHFNYEGSGTWQGYAFAQFNIIVPEGKQIKSATLNWRGTSTRAYTSKLYYLNKGRTVDFNAISAHTSGLLRMNGVKIWISDIESLSGGKSLETDVTAAVKAMASAGTIYFQWTANQGGADLYGKGSANAPTLEVVFEDIPKYRVSASATNGSVVITNNSTPVVSGSMVEDGTTLTFTANPAAGYQWSKWSDENTDNPRNITINGADVSLTAVFTPISSETISDDVTIGLTTLVSTNSQDPNAIATWKSSNGIIATESNGSTAEKYTKGDKGVNHGSDTSYYSLYTFKNNTKYSAFQTQQYVGYTVNIADGCTFSINGIDASIYASASMTWKVVICDDSENVLYTTDDTAMTNYKESTNGTTINVQNITEPQLQNLTGTYHVRVYYYFNGTGKYLCFPKLHLSGTVTHPTSVTATVVTGLKFGSFSSVYNVDFGNDENADVKAYTAKVNGSKVELTRHTGVLPAGQGVILYAPGTTKSQTFNVAAVATALTADNDMIGVPVATNVDKDAGGKAYVVYNNALHPLSVSGTIAAGKAYIRLNVATNVSMVFLDDDDEATGISDEAAADIIPANMKIFNLQGMEVKNPVKGRIYIINNKKCILK